MTIHIAVGNSDDNLTQTQWGSFVTAVDTLVRANATTVHGRWLSRGDDAYQNAAWAFDCSTQQVKDYIRRQLIMAAMKFQQDSVAWNESDTEFLRPNYDPGPYEAKKQ